MEILENLAEYYDELFPAASGQREFFDSLSSDLRKPVRFLSLGCGTGSFEHLLAQDGADVTGIEDIPDLIESANRRRRTQLMAIRFFNMSNLEIARFLGKGFYDIVFMLNWRILFSNDKILIQKLFSDCKSLLKEGGKFVVSLPDFDFFSGSEFALPVRKSIRASLSSIVKNCGNGIFKLNQVLETGNGKILKITKDAPICILNRDDLSALAKKSGFSKVSFSAGFDGNSKNELVAVFS